MLHTDAPKDCVINP